MSLGSFLAVGGGAAPGAWALAAAGGHLVGSLVMTALGIATFVVLAK
jgi:hypothetical protein